ncbi:MAG: hypothetical protein GVY18_14600 [Bacteroidetes bacterium]|nr:hypothetical protein [Bacteroidota bacterium]
MLILCGAASSRAQTVIPAKVTYIAGANIYLDAGRDAGIHPDDTLTVLRDEAPMGSLHVISSMSDRSVLTFVDDPFPVTLGTTLRLRLPEGAKPEQPQETTSEEDEIEQPVSPTELIAEADTVDTTPQKPSRTTRDRATRRRRRGGPRVSGRVMLSLNAVRSTTRWTNGTVNETQRTFATPSLNLHTRVRDLPGGVQFQTRLRADHRYTSGRSITPATSVRAYQAVLSKDIGATTVQAGRFYNRYEPFSGYWDGALVRYGRDHLGLGTAVGFMPERSNEGFSSEMPRYSAFAHLTLGERQRVEYDAEVSFNEIRPTGDLLTHRYAGVSQRLSTRWGSVRSDLQLDRDPLEGGWVASRFYVRGTVMPTRALHLRGRYEVRQSYSIWRTTRVISPRRDRASGGFSLRLLGGSLGGDLSVNLDDDATSRTWSGFVQHPDLGVWGLGLSANMSYWDADRGTSFFLNTGVSRRAGALRMRVSYQYSRTSVLTRDPLVTHAGTLRLVLPVGRRFFTSTQLRVQQGETLRSLSGNASVWWTF